MEALLNIRKLSNLHSTNVKSVVLCKNNFRMASTVNSKVDDTTIATTIDEDYETTMLQKENEIEIKRDKSRLRPQHKNLVHGRVPYTEPMTDAHLTFKYKRMLFGKFGKSSNVNPGTLWPTKSEIQEMVEYEKVAHPFSLSEMVEKQKRMAEEEEKMMHERQQKIVNNLKKLAGWKREIAARAEKKLAEIAKAKERRDALLEEVRRHFGYKVDPRDEKFKEMLIQKEKEQKKRLKEEKAKLKKERTQLSETSKEEK